MPIPDPLRSPFYESGGLVQACHACDLALRGHTSELFECPACGATMEPPLAIVFGGLGVVFNGKDFRLFSTSGLCGVIQRADCPEVVQFICRHAKDVRTGQAIRDAGPVRRIVKRRQFEDMLWERGMA